MACFPLVCETIITFMIALDATEASRSISTTLGSMARSESKFAAQVPLEPPGRESVLLTEVFRARHLVHATLTALRRLFNSCVRSEQLTAVIPDGDEAGKSFR